MTSRKIKITAIATVRNEHSVIEKFIESLLTQSYPPSEIIIVDGKSTDSTNEILQQYANNGKIRLLTRDCNIAEGRNLAVSLTDNEFIAVTDAGCEVDPNWLKEIVNTFESSEKPDVVAGNFKFDCHTAFEEAVVLGTFNPDREKTDAARNFPSSRSFAFTKKAWQTAKGYPEWLYAAEDTLFNIRLRQLGFKFVFAQKAIVKWRPRENWKALAKQRFNFARGNARVGIGTAGYKNNIISHSLMLVPIFASFIWPWLAFLALIPLYSHIKKNLWKQAVKAKNHSTRSFITIRVLLVMEFTRIIGIWGFLRGRLDRIIDKTYVTEQQKWMGVKSLDEII